LIGLNVVLVPLLGPLVGHEFSTKALFSGAIALFGLGLMSVENGTFAVGDLWMVVCALSYTIYILLLDSVAQRHAAIKLTAVQMVTVTFFALIWALSEQFVQGQQGQLPTFHLNILAIVLYLGVVATAATTWGQAFAQKHVSAYETALIYTLEPVFSLLFAFLLLHETIGIRGLVGASFILLGMVVSQLVTADATDVTSSGE
jgi:drug/metabolite transporter (DMT)-like permease